MNNENGNGSGLKYLSPSQQAWQTAKDRAVAEAQAREQENRDRGERERQEMIRALVDPYLSHGAARFFCLLCKAGWMKEFGGLHNNRVGAVLLEGRALARLCGGASVNCLYPKRRKEKREESKDGAGKILRSASVTVGWIEELVRGGYIWLAKQRVKNMPSYRWPNVYNVAVHVPQQVTPSLPFRDGQLLSENVIAEDCSPVENKDFAPSDMAGDGQTPANTIEAHRSGGLPRTAAGDGQAPERRIAAHRSGGLPRTARGDRPSVNPVQLRETLGSKGVPETKRGRVSPPDLVFEKWEKTLDRMFPRELESRLADLKGKVKTATTPTAKTEWKRRIEAVELRLNGPIVPDEPRASKPAAKPADEPLPEVLNEREREFAEGVAARLRKVTHDRL